MVSAQLSVLEVARRGQDRLVAAHVAFAALSFDEIRRGLAEHGVDVDRLIAELDEDLCALPKMSDHRRPKARLEATDGLQWGFAHGRDFGHRMAAALAGVLQVRSVARDRLTAHGVREEMLRPIAEPKSRPPGGDTSIVLHNDDVTPFAFVIGQLRTHLQLRELEAWDLANEVHLRGIARVWRCDEVEAGRLAALLTDDARNAGFPLRVGVEHDDSG
jgi:ATP-dependent Clp protease adapter protein ClpS